MAWRRRNLTFTQKALFAEDEWSLADTFKLTLGARYDRHSAFGSKVSPGCTGCGAWHRSGR